MLLAKLYLTPFEKSCTLSMLAQAMFGIHDIDKGKMKHPETKKFFNKNKAPRMSVAIFVLANL
tara:strand:- start:20 stop:208 length:189 start_codon:yes stop_codon:yes gene_type:complete